MCTASNHPSNSIGTVTDFNVSCVVNTGSLYSAPVALLCYNTSIVTVSENLNLPFTVPEKPSSR
ncbi:MAG: hypothetical protein ACI4OP_06335 [Candidatus Coprovivens sp.]